MSADTSREPLPVREKCTEAELRVLDCWMQDHGDPGEWSETTRLSYAATIAYLRSMGTI